MGEYRRSGPSKGVRRSSGWNLCTNCTLLSFSWHASGLDRHGPAESWATTETFLKFHDCSVVRAGVKMAWPTLILVIFALGGHKNMLGLKRQISCNVLECLVPLGPILGTCAQLGPVKGTLVCLSGFHLCDP